MDPIFIANSMHSPSTTPFIQSPPTSSSCASILYAASLSRQNNSRRRSRSQPASIQASPSLVTIHNQDNSYTLDSPPSKKRCRHQIRSAPTSPLRARSLPSPNISPGFSGSPSTSTVARLLSTESRKSQTPPHPPDVLASTTKTAKTRKSNRT